MGRPEAVIVSQFKGVHRPGLTTRITTRRILDEPREIYNMHLTDDGHLYIPECPDVLYDFSIDGNIQTIHYVENPRGVVVQMDAGKIFHIGIDPATGAYDPAVIDPTHIATMPAGEEQWNIWVNGTLDYFLMGYLPRGSAGPTDGQTWKVSGTHLVLTVENITATVEAASWSTLYKGRRFWVKRGRQVWFSALNEYDAPAEADATFTISGDDAGNGFVDNPGFVAGMSAWEDVLVFFLTGSVWIITGSDPDTYNLRQVQTMVGNTNPWTLMRTDGGVITLGGSNLNNPGIYLFTGSQAQKLSDTVDDWMLNVGRATATLSGGRYIFGCSRANADSRQFMILDMRTHQWVAFDGYIDGTAAVKGSTLYVSKEGILYSINGEIFPRCPGRSARITLGYQDDENPSGLVRYLGVKVAGRMWGTGGTLTVMASTPDGVVISDPQVIPDDVFDNFVIPLNIRGAAIEIQLEFTIDDDTELLIENLQVILSRKGEKVSRA